MAAAGAAGAGGAGEGAGGGRLEGGALLVCGFEEGPAWIGVGIVKSRER